MLAAGYTSYPGPANWTATCLTGRAVPVGVNMWRFEPLFVFYSVHSGTGEAMRVTPNGTTLQYERFKNGLWCNSTLEERARVFQGAQS